MDAATLTDETCGTIDLGDGARVRRMGFGAMRLTGDGIWGPPDDLHAARALLRRVVELGVQLIDTADAYGPDVNEDLIAEALHPYPDDLVIATKGGLIRQGPGRWSSLGHPAHLRAACEASLRRLRVDAIDLYQLHSPDEEIPYEESIGTLAELRDEGKILRVGVSNVDADQLRLARAIVPVTSVQNRYNLVDRSSEAVLRACEADGIAFLPWFPLAAGDFGDATTALDEIGEAHETTGHAVGLAWLLARSPVMAPIPGTSSLTHLEQNVAAASLRLTDAELERLDGFSPAVSEKLDKLSAPRSAATQQRIAERAGFFERWWRRLTGRDL